MKELVGKVILSMWVNENQSLLKFVTNQGELVYTTEGDCCSETWFADILFDYRFNTVNPVVEVEELEVPEFVNKLASRDGRTRQEYDLVYGYKITLSDNTSVNIIFRNSSNGFYYGWCEFLDTTNSWYERKLKESSWEQVLGDWSA